jgi:hypothetical protein
MLESNPFEVTLQSGLNLEVRARMTGPHHQFKSGKLGYLWRDNFDWSGKRWRLRFQAFVMKQSSGTTHGMLEENREDVVPSMAIIVEDPVKDSKDDSMPLTHIERLIEACREAQDHLEAGWKLKKLPGGINAVFDLNRVRQKPSGKLYSFASCNVEIEGVLYLCQFHIHEQLDPLPKPTAWDWRRGARAGIPTLGKRR